MRKRSVVLQAGIGDKHTLHPRVFRVRLDPTQAEQLYRHAAARGVDPDAFFLQIIKTIFSEDLIDAVIDDDKPGAVDQRQPNA